MWTNWPTKCATTRISHLVYLATWESSDERELSPAPIQELASSKMSKNKLLL